LVQRVNAHIQTGHFHDTDELLEKALDALDERAPSCSAAGDGKPARSCWRRYRFSLIRISI
jgi:hypothetical protein